MLLHASAVAFGGSAGILITGASGNGKSTLCSELIALGAQLIGDDQVQLSCANGQLVARGAPELSGLLELYGIGIVQLPDDRLCGQAPLAFEVQLNAENQAPERLPEMQYSHYLGQSLPRFELPAFSPTLASKMALLAQVFQQFGLAGLVDVAKPNTKG